MCMKMTGIRALNTPWLDAFTDAHAGIYTFSHCITMADINGDGDYKLIIADLGTGSSNIRLKVYKGTSLMTESVLTEAPTGVVSVYMDTNENHVPGVVVASGPNVYIYKNLRPYFKFTVPSLDVSPMEKDLWSQVRDQSLETDVFYEFLQNLRQEIGFNNLTERSQQLLILDHSKRKEFVEEQKNLPPKKQTVITCVSTLKKSMTDEDAISCIVFGTESGEIYILESEAFVILQKVQLEGGEVHSPAPAHIACSGLYDVEFRIVCLCRDGTLRLLRRGWQQTRTLTELTAPAVGLLLMPDGTSSIIVALMDSALHCFSKKGRRQWKLQMEKNITAIGSVHLPQQGLCLVAVALSGGLVKLYSGQQLVDTIATPDTVAALRFGRFGQEENSLVLIAVAGCLMVKILKRTANFVTQTTTDGFVPGQQVKVPIPKKTRLFVEQTMRERQCYKEIHQAFQHDLFRMHLTAARACVQALQSCSLPVSSKEPLKLTAQVLGLGPKFRLAITLQNMSKDVPLKGLFIVVHCDDKMYVVERPFIEVPMLVPSLTYKFDTIVECVSDLNISDEVRVFVVKQQQTEPLLSVVIEMPVCDMLAMTS
ncbi:Bardet-Biedl syndrome 1 protein homolog [Schistocerca americana]|uniref:Bardet-Biedl syndrome 1 protein homolog n=1 Tax=Schistocerca americana TaxID=7009 RepID=UPI001F4FDBF1|nr:Bardet-Biedl syndrome 1 protein homolog [Schistocerca americana]